MDSQTAQLIAEGFMRLVFGFLVILVPLLVFVRLIMPRKND